MVSRLARIVIATTETNEIAMTEMSTTATASDTPRRGRRRVSLLCSISGVLAAGQVVLLLIVTGVRVISWLHGYPGQDWWLIGWHVVAAVLAVVMQRFADRHNGPTSWVSSVAVIVVAFATLCVFWWF